MLFIDKVILRYFVVGKNLAPVLLVFFGLVIQNLLVSQTTDTLTARPDNIHADSDTSKIYELFDLKSRPEFPGGDAQLMKFLAENIKLPPLSREQEFRTTFIAEFIIEKTGCLRRVKTLKFPDDEMAKEFIRVIKSMPCWSPGYNQNDEPVRVRYTLPLRICPQ